MDKKMGVYDRDPCPNCGYPRKQGELCPRCRTSIVRIGVGMSNDVSSTRARLLISPQCHPHTCGIPASGKGHCVHCDTGYICPTCRHNGMQTKDRDPKKPAHFILRCPKCGCEKSIHWIEYDIKCPRCGNPHAFGTHTKLLEPIIKCPDCGDVLRNEVV